MRQIDKDLIKREVEKNRDEIVEWTKRLIGIQSENRPPFGYEKGVQEFLRDELISLGLDVDIFSPSEVAGIQKHPFWLDGRKYGDDRKNVVAKWSGKGGRSLLFSGHADVAPREPGEWKKTGPFNPLVEDGKLYGRGSADMKGGMASAFWAIKLLKGLGYEPRGDIIFESVVDEEFAGGNGTLASRLKGYNTDLAILTEPTRMELCIACLGALLGEITLKGKSGMPFMGEIIPNPVYGLSRLIEIFRDWEKKWASSNTHPLFKENGKELKILIWDIKTDDTDNFTQMSTPLRANISWIVWCYPGEDEDRFMQDFKKFWHERASEDKDLGLFDIEIRQTYHYVRPWETDIEDIGIAETINSYREYSGKIPDVTGAPFSCDYALYCDTGNIPTVILGPRGDNLHAPDEWVLIDDILALAGIFANLSLRWCSQRKLSVREGSS
jgi:acetylornithine deacetylase